MFARRLGCVVTAAAIALQFESVPPATAQDKATPIEYVGRLRKPPGEGLGTVDYEPSQDERPFFERLAQNQRQTGGLAGTYDITAHKGHFVGWFGIVREVAENPQTKRTTLTVEHKYFDGLTDAHLMALSFNGSGDFVAELLGIDSDIEPLTLVKVYGQVGESLADGRPTLQAVYVRNWLSGAYTFLMAAGDQRGSDRWRALNKVPLDDIYDPYPESDYYVARLGPLPAAVLERRDAKTLRAAGSVDPELKSSLLALINGLRQGMSYTRSPAVTRRCTDIRQRHGDEAAAKVLAAIIRSPLHDHTGDEAMAFRQFPEASVTELSGLLSDPQASVRRNAAELLGNLLPAARTAIPLLIQRLDDRQDVRQAAIDTLGRLGEGSPAVRAAVLPLLEDSSVITRITAAKCLLSLGIGEDTAMDALVAGARNDAVSVRYEAVAAIRELEALAAPAVPVLIDLLRDSDESLRYAAAESLSKLGADAKPAVLPLAAALRDNESFPAAAAASALGRIGLDAEAAIPQLSAAAIAEDSTLRGRAAEALGNIHQQPEQCVPLLIRLLQDEDDHVQFLAAGALCEFGKQAEPATKPLLKLLRSGSTEHARWHAAFALGRISHSDEAVRALQDALADSSPSVRRFAAASLGEIGTDASAAQEALVKAQADSDVKVRIAAAGAAILTGGPVPPSLEVLVRDMNREHTWLDQMTAADEIARIGPRAKPLVPQLIGLLDAEERYVRSSAAQALGAIGTEAQAAVGALEARLQDRDAYVAAGAAAALWKIARHPSSIPGLETALKSRDSMAQNTAASALADIGPDASAAVSTLQGALQDRNSDVRKLARVALTKITGNPGQ